MEGQTADPSNIEDFEFDLSDREEDGAGKEEDVDSGEDFLLEPEENKIEEGGIAAEPITSEHFQSEEKEKKEKVEEKEEEKSASAEGSLDRGEGSLELGEGSLELGEGDRLSSQTGSGDDQGRQSLPSSSDHGNHVTPKSDVRDDLLPSSKQVGRDTISKVGGGDDDRREISVSVDGDDEEVDDSRGVQPPNEDDDEDDVSVVVHEERRSTKSPPISSKMVSSAPPTTKKTTTTTTTITPPTIPSPSQQPQISVEPPPLQQSSSNVAQYKKTSGKQPRPMLGNARSVPAVAAPPQSNAAAPPLGSVDLYEPRFPDQGNHSMPLVCLKRLFSPSDKPDGGSTAPPVTKVELGVGSTYIGRGPFLGVTEVKCSRRQLILRVEPPTLHRDHSSSRRETLCPVYLTAIGVNPSVLHRVNQEAVIMNRDEPYLLNDGDRFSLLVNPPVVFRCDFITEEPPPHQQHPPSQQISPHKKREKTHRRSSSKSERGDGVGRHKSTESLNKGLTDAPAPSRGSNTSRNKPGGSTRTYTASPVTTRAPFKPGPIPPPPDNPDIDLTITPNTPSIISGIVNLFSTASTDPKRKSSSPTRTGASLSGSGGGGGGYPIKSLSLTRKEVMEEVENFQGSTGGGSRSSRKSRGRPPANSGKKSGIDLGWVAIPKENEADFRKDSVGAPENSSKMRRKSHIKQRDGVSSPEGVEELAGLSDLDSDELSALQADIRATASELAGITKDDSEDDHFPDQITGESSEESGGSKVMGVDKLSPTQEKHKLLRMKKLQEKQQSAAAGGGSGTTGSSSSTSAADAKKKTQMLIESYRLGHQKTLSIKDFVNPKWDTTQSIPGKAPKWDADELIHNCCLCRCEFTWVERKHHCRLCGKIFCEACSSFRIDLPNTFEEHAGNQRICFRCHSAYSPIAEATKLRLFEITKAIGLHEKPQFLAHVFYTWTSSPTPIRTLGLLMVGKYRLILLTPSPDAAHEMRYICDLRQIKSSHPEELVLEFRKLFRFFSSSEPEIHQQIPLISDLKLETPRAADAIRAICDSFFALVPPFDLFLRICAEHALPLKEHVLQKKDEKSALVSRYIAMSDYVSTIANSNIALLLSNKLETKDTVLNLDALPTERQDSNEAVAVAACLRGLTSFTHVICTKSPRPVPFVCHALRFSTRITTLRLVSRHSEIEELGRAMKANPSMPLKHLDLSGSSLNNINSVIWLAGGIRLLTSGLEHVNFSNCSLTPKAVAFLINRGLESNPEIEALSFFDMSHNEFGHNGTESLSRLLKSIAQKNGGNLKQLKLGDCRLDMKQIVPFLGALLHLELLNVSGNVFGTGNVGGFLSVLRERSAPLSTLNVSGCSLSPDEVSVITHGFLSAPRSQTSQNRYNLNIGKNQLSSRLFPSVPAGGGCWKLETLDLSNSALLPRLFSAIVRRLSSPDMQVRTLVLHNALAPPSDVEAITLGQHLGSLVMGSPHLVALVLSGGYSLAFLVSFLDSIASNKTLCDLDLRANGGGDTLLFHLAQFLQTNSSLLSVYVDENGATDKGWQALALVLQTSNKTLQHMGFPWKDFHERLSLRGARGKRAAVDRDIRNSSWAKFHSEAQQVMQRLYIHRCQMREPFQSGLENILDESFW